MFTEDDLKKIPEYLAQATQQMEREILADIVRRISETGSITRTADYELYRLSQLSGFNKDYKKMIQSMLKLSDEKMKELYEKIISEGYARDEQMYKAVGVEFVPLSENKEVLQLIQAVQEQYTRDVRNICNSLGVAIDGRNMSIQSYYNQLLNKTLVEVATGTFDYNTAIKKTVNDLANSGVRYIEYESGRHDRVDVAVRRAIMTGLRQVTAKIEDDNAERLHTNLFEVSAHATARPTHALWQGRIYTKEQLKDICGLGEVTGLCGVNCYHNYHPFIEGYSKRLYSDEQLHELFTKTQKEHVYNNRKYTLYEALQRMRTLERRMRVQDEKIELLKIGKGDKNDVISIKNRRIATYDEYRNFAKAMNLREDMTRVFTK